jgi:tetratricopeptide (TPR) repeat protein
MWQIACAQILMSHSHSDLAQEIFTNALSIAEKYEFYHIALLASHRLEDTHSTKGNTQKHDRVKRQTDANLKSLTASIEARRSYDIFIHIIQSTTDYTSQQIRSAKKAALNLENIASRCNLHSVRILSFDASIVVELVQSNFRKAIEIGEEAILYLNTNNNFQTRTRVGGLLRQLSYSYYQIGDTDTARRFADESLQLSVKKTANWSYRVAQRICVSIAEEKWEHTAQLLEELLSYISQKRKTNEFWLEEVLLYHGYLCYIVRCDKSGANVPRLVLQVLLMLADENLDGVISKSESLRQYRQVYLKDKKYNRSSSFLKLLHLIIEQEFSIKAVIQKGAKYIRELDVQHGEGVYEGNEPIAYRRLWEIVESHLHLLAKKLVVKPIPMRISKRKKIPR